MDSSILLYSNNGFNEKNSTGIHQHSRYNGSMPFNGHLNMNIARTHTYCNLSFIRKHQCLKL